MGCLQTDPKKHTNVGGGRERQGGWKPGHIRARIAFAVSPGALEGPRKPGEGGGRLGLWFGFLWFLVCSGVPLTPSCHTCFLAYVHSNTLFHLLPCLFCSPVCEVAQWESTCCFCRGPGFGSQHPHHVAHNARRQGCSLVALRPPACTRALTHTHTHAHK